MVLINADFSRRACVAPSEYQWVASPRGEVERVMLDRLGGEQARATSLVRYAPGAGFPGHQHPGGEEILVLSGVFREHDQTYPALWYLRNPPGSAHEPSSPEGTVIFVKLWQMTPDERHHVRIDANDPANWRHGQERDICPLFENAAEHTSLQRLAAGAALFDGVVNGHVNGADGGAELLVIAGSLVEMDRHHPCGTWIRLPHLADAPLVAGPRGATVYLKTGHLAALAAEGA